MKESYKVLLSGVVQGVGFRYYVYRKAKKYEISGYVKNLSDGRVEIVASGDRDMLNSFLEEVKRGPMMARIENAEIHPANDPGIEGFIIE